MFEIAGAVVTIRSIHEIVSDVKVPLDDPQFLSRVFNLIAKERKTLQAKDGDNLRRVCAEEYEDLSDWIDATHIQDSCAVRNILRTRRLANLLINDKGELNQALIPRVIAHITSHLHSLGPERQHDSRRNEHILKVLQLLRDNKDISPMLRRISKPLSHPLADQIIRETLQLPSNTIISDAHARRAALSAWMTTLRQNIGSCFATAPAIIVHDEQPELFLKDLYELLGTGRLKRVAFGMEYTVPLVAKWGSGDLRKPLFLSLEESGERDKVWHSPGVILALENVGILPIENSVDEKVGKVKQLVEDAFPELKRSQTMLLTSVEEVLRRILLKHLNLTQADLDAYEQRPKEMIHTSLLMQMPTTGAGTAGKGNACANLYAMLHSAESTFKGLAENALLKAWEYTLASFSETKSDFTRWNLYASLGLAPEYPGGIGECLYKIIKHKLDDSNQKLADMESEYQNVFAQVKQLEIRLRHTSTDKDGQWAHAEYQSKVSEFRILEEMRNQEHARAGLFVRLFDILVGIYDHLFPTYFQEVYDVDLHTMKMGFFDDSPAGFRLLYKHGRSNTSQWTAITSPHEFIDALTRFFMMTETEVSSTDILEGIQKDVADIVTSIITHVKTKEFLETAFQRMAEAHHTPQITDPLENWERAEAKPWAYISGGTMRTLVTCYYSREQPPTEVERWVENPMELLVFLIDTLKHSPQNIMEEFVKSPNKSILMHSPTHAFLLRPGYATLKNGWYNDAHKSYTYTWVRDQLVLPMEHFVNNLELTESMMRFLLDKFVKLVPENFRFYFKKVFSVLYGRMSVKDFRYHLIDRILHERGLQYEGRGVLSSDEIDNLLYSYLPLHPQNQVTEHLRMLWQNMPEMTPELQTQLEAALDVCKELSITKDFVTAQGLQDICQALYCLVLGKTSLPFNLTQEIYLQAQKLGFAMPMPIIFADTNWSRDYFALLVSPGTGNLELWRVDPIGKTGTPMSQWQQWVDGSRKDLKWGVYSRPNEYTFAPQFHQDFKFTRPLR